MPLEIGTDYRFPTFDELPVGSLFCLFGTSMKNLKLSGRSYMMLDEKANIHSWDEYADKLYQKTCVIPLGYLKEECSFIPSVVKLNTLKYGDMFILPLYNNQKSSLHYYIKDYPKPYCRSCVFFNSSTNKELYYAVKSNEDKDGFCLVVKPDIDILKENPEGPLIRFNNEYTICRS